VELVEQVVLEQQQVLMEHQLQEQVAAVVELAVVRQQELVELAVVELVA
jgi:hypothetical protein